LELRRNDMRIGDRDIETCNRYCPAYEWAGESMSKGDHGMRCAFGAFHSFYGDEHPIPDDCPIKACDCSAAEAAKIYKCDVCGWEGPRSALTVSIVNKETKMCPECGWIEGD
jgi:predicted RNA-binding Zn-ribbon protein involved in translation (DUF1610 family)